MLFEVLESMAPPDAPKTERSRSRDERRHRDKGGEEERVSDLRKRTREAPERDGHSPKRARDVVERSSKE